MLCEGSVDMTQLHWYTYTHFRGGGSRDNCEQQRKMADGMRPRKHHKRNGAEVKSIKPTDESESWSTHNSGGGSCDSYNQQPIPYSRKMADGPSTRQKKHHHDHKCNGAEVKAIKQTEESESWSNGSNCKGSAGKNSDKEEGSPSDGSNREYGTEEEDIKEAAGNDPDKEEGSPSDGSNSEYGTEEEDIKEAAGNDSYEKNGRTISWRWLIGCAVILVGIAAAFGVVVVHPVHSDVDTELEGFENFFDELTSTSHEGNIVAVKRIPVVFMQARYQLDTAINVILRSDLSGEEWQESMMKDTKQVSHLLRDAAEEMFDYLLRGRTMMTYMVDLGLPSISKAFHDGEYSIVLQVLEDMEQHIQNADASVTTARGKLRDGYERAENVLESMQKKISVLFKDADEAGKGWSTGTKMAVYGTVMALTVVTGVAAVPIYGLGAGVVGGGAAAMKQWIDNADGEELTQQLKSEAHELEGAYDNMSGVRENLQQVSMYVRQLRVALNDAEQSVMGLHGQLESTQAKKFYYRLKEFARRCRELQSLYEKGIADYHAENKKHQQGRRVVK